jgi:hypothetical protein
MSNFSIHGIENQRREASMEKIVIDTINRILELMGKHWDAKSYKELTDQENDEASFLLKRIKNFSVLKQTAPERFNELGITKKEMMIINNFLDWFKSIGEMDK